MKYVEQQGRYPNLPTLSGPSSTLKFLSSGHHRRGSYPSEYRELFRLFDTMPALTNVQPPTETTTVRPQLKLPYQTRQPFVHVLHDFFLIDSYRGQSSKLVLPSPSKPVGESAQISPTANVSTLVKVCFRRNVQSSLLILISLAAIHLHLSVLRRPSTPPLVLSDGSSILIMMIFTSLHAVPCVFYTTPIEYSS